MILFMALTAKKISLSLRMPYNHGVGNSYFGAVCMPGTWQPLFLLIFSKCYENVSLDPSVVDRDHLKEIKQCARVSAGSGFETRTSLSQHVCFFHHVKGPSLSFLSPIEVFMWLHKMISLGFRNDHVNMGM